MGKSLSFFDQALELADAEPKGDLSRWDTKKAAAISSSQSVFRFPGTPVGQWPMPIQCNTKKRSI